LAATPRMLASLLAVVLLTFFFMVYGVNLQRNAIALMPGRQQKKFTVEILQSIEREVSRYVLTISLINTVVGLLFAGVLVLLDFSLSEALLWGTMVALLNFAPYVGPLIGMVAMLLVGFMTFDGLWPSLMPAAVDLVLHTIEGQVVTPIVLGRSMALSPLVLILALMLFGWLWGIVGLLLAAPLLVCVKLVLARIEGRQRWSRLLELPPSRPRPAGRRVAGARRPARVQYAGEFSGPRHHPRPRRHAVAVRAGRRPHRAGARRMDAQAQPGHGGPVPAAGD